MLGDLAIDYDRRRVTVAGRPVALTATEYELLRVLSLNAGRVTTSETLLNRVWARRGNGNTKVVRAFVKQLRQKLGDDAASPAWIFQRARRRLPHAPTGRPGRALTSGNRARRPPAHRRPQPRPRHPGTSSSSAERPLQGERVGRDVRRHRRVGPPVGDEGPVVAVLSHYIDCLTMSCSGFRSRRFRQLIAMMAT